MKTSIFTILLLLVICIVPVSADDYGGGYFHLSGSTEAPTIEYELDVQDTAFVFDAPEGYAIAGLELWINPGAAANWTLFSDDYSVSGWHDYQKTGFLNATGSYFTTAVGSNVVVRYAVAPGWHYPEIFGCGPAIKYSGGALDYEVLSQGVFAYTPNYIWSSVHRDPDRTVYQEISQLQVFRSVQVTNYDPVGQLYPATIYLVTEERALSFMGSFQVGAAWSYGEEFSSESLLDVLWRVWGLMGSVFTVLVILEYIFVEHFFEVVVLYEIILISYSAAKSRDFATFSKKFIKANTALFDFIILLVERLITIITNIINALKPI